MGSNRIARWIRALPVFDRLYPELKRFEDPHDRDDALTNALHGLLLNKYYIIILVSYCACIVAAPYVLRKHGTNMDPQWFFLIMCLPLVALPHLAFRNTVRRHLRIELLTRGIPICLHCGCDLTGFRSVRCFECGNETPLPLRNPQDSNEDGWGENRSPE